MQARYQAILDQLKTFIPKQRLISDPLRTLAYGTDASFYRLIPQLVVRVENEQEVIKLISLANAHALPLTFRAAGTSLSGQAVTDSILVQLGMGGMATKSTPMPVKYACNPVSLVPMPTVIWHLFSARSDQTPPPSTPPKLAALPPTMPAACVVVRRRTVIARSPACV